MNGHAVHFPSTASLNLSHGFLSSPRQLRLLCAVCLLSERPAVCPFVSVISLSAATAPACFDPQHVCTKEDLLSRAKTVRTWTRCFQIPNESLLRSVKLEKTHYRPPGRSSWAWRRLGSGLAVILLETYECPFVRFLAKVFSGGQPHTAMCVGDGVNVCAYEPGRPAALLLIPDFVDSLEICI